MACFPHLGETVKTHYTESVLKNMPTLKKNGTMRVGRLPSGFKKIDEK